MASGVLGAGEAYLGLMQLGAVSSNEDNLTQSVFHVLGIEQNTGPLRAALSPLLMTHNVFHLLEIGTTQNLAHSLGLSQEVVSALNQFPSHSLDLVQIVDVVNFGPIIQNLNIEHIAYYDGPVYVSASNTIALTHLASYPIEVDITQALGITDQAADVQKHELSLAHVAMAYINQSPHFEDDLDLTHEVQVTAAYDAQIAHTSVVTQAVTFWIDDGTSCPGNQYENFGTLGDIPFTVETGAKMTFKAIDGVEDIVFLRNPELDDRDRLGYTRINRETEGGELQVFRDPTWPLVNTLQGTIVGLKLEDVNDLLDFFSDHLGEEISLNDWHGRYWRGIILNPGEPAVEDTRDRWTVAFEFEGIEMPGPDILQQVGISHGLSVIQDLTRDMADNLGIGHSVAFDTNQVLHNGDFVFYIGDKVIYSGPP